MNDLSQKNVVIKITKAKKKYYVSIKPYGQVEQIFCHKKVKEAYREIFRFVMGYLAGYVENYPLNFEELNTIITTLTIFWDIDIEFMMV